jgi:Tetrapyrrole (Corrin/Porphyrin) Methylases
MTSNSSDHPQAGPFDIYIAGLGIMGIWHLTHEAENCIKASKQVFIVDHGFGVSDYLQTLCPKVTSLLGEYEEGLNRLETYRSMAAAVIAAALEDGPVCFAPYGHPVMYVYPTMLIRNAAKLLGLRLHIAPGISIFDTMLVDLDFDPGLTGVQIYEATALLIENRQLQPDVPCVLLQVDAIESGLFSRAPSAPRRFIRLQEHLLRFYPPEHSVIGLLSSTFPLVPALKREFPLSELPERLAETPLGGTLFIPPIGKRGRGNEEILSQLFDQEYLAEITRPGSAEGN